jgi:hypothetical protein
MKRSKSEYIKFGPAVSNDIECDLTQSAVEGLPLMKRSKSEYIKFGPAVSNHSVTDNHVVILVNTCKYTAF